MNSAGRAGCEGWTTNWFWNFMHQEFRSFRLEGFTCAFNVAFFDLVRSIYVGKKRPDLEFCTVIKHPLLMKRRNVNNMQLLSWDMVHAFWSVYELFLRLFNGVSKYGTWYKSKALVGGCPHEELMSSRRLIREQDGTNDRFISHIHVRFLSCVIGLIGVLPPSSLVTFNWKCFMTTALRSFSH